MNALTLPRNALPAVATLPAISPGLRAALGEWAQPPHPDVGAHGPALTPMQRDEAVALAGAVEHLLQPAPAALVALWLARFRVGPTFAPAEAELDVVASALVQAGPDLPWSAFTSASLAAALRTFDTWPSVARLYAFLRDWVRPTMALRDSIALAQEATAPRRHREPTDAEREAVRANVAQLGVPDAAVRERMGARVAPLSDGALLAHYEAIGQGETPRAEMLRGRIRRAAEVAA